MNDKKLPTAIVTHRCTEKEGEKWKLM